MVYGLLAPRLRIEPMPPALESWSLNHGDLQGSLSFFSFSLGYHSWASRVAQTVKHAGDLGSIPGSGRSPGVGNGNPLQCSRTETPRTEEPGGPRATGSQRVGHDWATITFSEASCVTKFWKMGYLWKVGSVPSRSVCEEKMNSRLLLLSSFPLAWRRQEGGARAAIFNRQGWQGCEAEETWGWPSNSRPQVRAFRGGENKILSCSSHCYLGVSITRC